MTPSQSSRFSIVAAAQIEMPGVTTAREAWDRAEQIRHKIANVMDEYGIRDKDPLVNVWDGGDA